MLNLYDARRRRSRHRVPRWGSLACLTISILIAGCVTPESDSEDIADSGPKVIRLMNQPDDGAIINATLNPSVLEFHWVQMPERENCPMVSEVDGQSVDRRLSVTVIDSEGVLQSFRLNPPRNQPEGLLHLPTTGKPPYLFHGDFNLCMSPHGSLENVTDGFLLPYVRPKLWEFSAFDVDVVVPVGASSGESQWSPRRQDFNLVQSYNLDDRMEGAPFGTIRLIDPEGNTTRVESYGLTGWETDFEGFMLIRGPYTIRLDLDAPASTTTTWTYHIDTWTVTKEICNYGFHWPDFCPS